MKQLKPRNHKVDQAFYLHERCTSRVFQHIKQNCSVIKCRENVPLYINNETDVLNILPQVIVQQFLP
jgi:hypothetical protein